MIFHGFGIINTPNSDWDESSNIAFPLCQLVKFDLLSKHKKVNRMKTMTKIFYTLAIMIALVLANIQGINAQTKFGMRVQTLCDDNCTTQEDCVYQFSWILIDQCGQENEVYCQDSTNIHCIDMYAGYTLPVQCQGCTEATHDPCFFLAGRVRKICIGPGGPHIICEDTDYKYCSCNDLTNGNVILLFDF